MSHFIRGFFDGDGCATYCDSNGYKKYNINFVCTKEFSEGLRKELEKVTDQRVQNVDSRKVNIILKTIGISSQLGIKDFYNYIYKDAEIFLARKKDKIEEIINFPMKIKNKKFSAVSPKGVKHFADKVLSFRTELEIVDEYTVNQH